MSIGIFLLALSLTSLFAGATLALDIRGAASALARRGEANAELRRHLRGDLGAPGQSVSPGFFRFLGTAGALASLPMLLVALLELAG
ncbi:hypothetical protein [Streptomyces sp. cmx-4-9]|uniref:hypothetical protein n=1 Tax=Streptomyces sp. cmx-4-9 TaxID=2790941 RepID=UPI00397ED18E